MSLGTWIVDEISGMSDGPFTVEQLNKMFAKEKPMMTYTRGEVETAVRHGVRDKFGAGDTGRNLGDHIMSLLPQRYRMYDSGSSYYPKEVVDTLRESLTGDGHVAQCRDLEVAQKLVDMLNKDAE